jgi:hypothetical protein
MQEADWDPEKIYSQDPPTCLHYLIEWKVTRNGRALSRGTEPDVVLAPSSYWQRHLKAQVEDLVNQKAAESGAIRLNDTNIVVSVTQRSQRDLAKHFPKTDGDTARGLGLILPEGQKTPSKSVIQLCYCTQCIAFTFHNTSARKLRI